MSDIVVDSCVLISAIATSDVNHVVARAFFAHIGVREDMPYVASTTLWDVAGATNRPGRLTDDRVYLEDLQLGFRLLDVTEKLFEETHRPGAVFVSGADRVIVSCAIKLQAMLVTFDKQLLAGCAHFGVTAITPQEYLKLA